MFRLLRQRYGVIAAATPYSSPRAIDLDLEFSPGAVLGSRGVIAQSVLLVQFLENQGCDAVERIVPPRVHTECLATARGSDQHPFGIVLIPEKAPQRARDALEHERAVVEMVEHVVGIP